MGFFFSPFLVHGLLAAVRLLETCCDSLIKDSFMDKGWYLILLKDLMLGGEEIDVVEVRRELS